ncbi:MAG: thiamine phosphate synthase [Pirellula sp.]
MNESHDHSQIVLRRMLDANTNRVMEGLRTLEDVARFSGWIRLQVDYKSIRHSLQQSIDELGQDYLGQAALVSARDAQGDVGRESKTTQEMQRPEGLVSIVAAAASRVEQGLRVIEEATKVLAPNQAASIERQRYKVYDLNAALQLACQRDLGFLQQAKLYVLVDCQLAIDAFGRRISEISQAGVQLIQIRDKHADAIRVLEYFQVAQEAVESSATRVLINDRVDIAATTNAAGVHIGQEDLPVRSSRRILQPWQYLGLSTHDLGQVQKGVETGVDYIGCGPTFASQTKSFDSFSGIPFLRQAASWLQANAPAVPAFAIGGIQLENLPQVLEAGFARVAVSSCVWNAQNPPHMAEKLRQMLDRA